PDTTTTTGDPPTGVDVSHWQGTVDWDAAIADGVGFAIVKATEGTYYATDAVSWDNQYWESFDAGLIRGAYHFAIPDDSTGAEQADWFVDMGGGWVADGQTLPGTLDIEWNPYGVDACYGLTQSEMIDWIGDFLDQYYVRTGREAMIYTANSWWAECVDSPDFAAWPLWIANWGVVSPTLPVGWTDYTFWQDSATGSVDGISGDVDTDLYNGSPDQLYHFALEP
ncbi:MAG: GH25 family lysozyme, partial [Myxococcota bacterium]